MNKKEKEIIEKLKKEDIENIQETMSDTFYLLNIKELKTVLNLIDKQQKEIEKLKKQLNLKIVMLEHMPEDTELILMCKSDFERNYGSDFISKDKIRENIKELEKEIEEKQEHGLDFTLIHEHEIDTNAIIQVLEELLEE